MQAVIVMEKSSLVSAPVMAEIHDRKSRRAYADQPVEEVKIKALFEAARWAPSSMNEQPWMYLYATKHNQPKLWSTILETLNESNRIWAKEAHLLIVSLFRKNHIRNGAPNGSARYDLGGANAFLSLQATHLGLNIHQMGGFDREKAKVDLNVPDQFDFGVVMAVGYPGDASQLPDNLKIRELAPRERYIQNEFVMTQSF